MFDSLYFTREFFQSMVFFFQNKQLLVDIKNTTFTIQIKDFF